MKRLIILTYDYSPNNGGIARLCREIKRQCEANNLEHVVISPVPGPDERNVVRITGRRGIVEWRILRYLRRIRREGDVVVCGVFQPESILARQAGFPTYVLAHGAELLPRFGGLKKWAWDRYRRHVLRRAECVIANSHYTLGLVQKCCPKARSVALPLAVDEQRFRPGKPKPSDGMLHLCSISRLEKFKAHDFILHTIARLPEAYRRKIRLTIGGKGPYKPALEKLTKDLGLEDTVRFLGFVAEEDLNDFYSSHHVFILCTREAKEIHQVEGFGLVFTEAQACGTSVIGSCSGGIPDAIDEHNGGWLIPQDDEAALKALLVRLIAHPEEVEEQCRKARLRVEEHCTWNGYFNQLLTYIR